MAGDVVDLGSVPPDALQVIRYTPSAALGTSRLRLTAELLPRALAGLKSFLLAGPDRRQ